MAANAPGKAAHDDARTPASGGLGAHEAVLVHPQAGFQLRQGPIGRQLEHRGNGRGVLVDHQRESAHLPRREIRDSRIALDEALLEAKGTLGESTSDFTVITNSAVIVFREGLEAVLILLAVRATL